MTMAASVTQSSRLSYEQMNIKRLAGTLKTDLATFIVTVNALFPDENAPERSIGNWLVPLASVSGFMTATPGTVQIDVFNQAVDFVARLSWSVLVAFGGSRITAGQQTAYLAAWNTAFGT